MNLKKNSSVTFLVYRMRCNSITDCILKGDGWKWPKVESGGFPEALLSSKIESAISIDFSHNSTCVRLQDSGTLKTSDCTEQVAFKVICLRDASMDIMTQSKILILMRLEKLLSSILDKYS